MRIVAFLCLTTGVVMGALWFARDSIGPLLAFWIGALAVSQAMAILAIWRALLASRSRRVHDRDGPFTLDDLLQSLKAPFDPR